MHMKIELHTINLEVADPQASNAFTSTRSA